MSDYIRDDVLDTPYAANSLNDVPPAKDKVERTLDKAESIAARRWGALRARELRNQADAALVQGRGMYDQARESLDRNLATAPYRTVGLAAFAGLVAGMLLTPRRKKIVYVKGR